MIRNDDVLNPIGCPASTDVCFLSKSHFLKINRFRAKMAVAIQHLLRQYGDIKIPIIVIAQKTKRKLPYAGEESSTVYGRKRYRVCKAE